MNGDHVRKIGQEFMVVGFEGESEPKLWTWIGIV